MSKPMLSNKDLTYQHLIARKFGYADEWIEDFFADTAFHNGKKKRIDIDIEKENMTHKCAFCGEIFPLGLKGKDIYKPNIIFSATYTETYSIQKPRSKDGIHFACAPCIFAYKNYKKKKMQNIVVFKDRVEHINIQSNPKNEMYDYIMTPPDEPFIMIINSRGTVLEFLTHLAIPTISKEMITIIFGVETMYIDKDLLTECLDKTIELMNRYKLNKNILLNTQADESRYTYANAKKIIEDKELLEEMGKYFLKYNRETRVIAGKLLEKHKIVTKNR